mgnify:CR=1 FL=1
MKISDFFSARIFQLTGQPGKEGQGAAGKILQDLNLQIGQLVKGTVVGLGKGGNVLLELGGREISAKTDVPLAPGREVWLEVIEIGKSPRLAMAEKKAESIQFLRQFVSQYPELKNIVFKLFAAAGGGEKMSDLSPANMDLARQITGMLSLGSEPEIGKLVAFLRLFSGAAKGEGTDRTLLKLQLAELIANLQGAGDKEMEGGLSAQKLEKLASLLETLAGLNNRPAAADQQPYFIFPCFLHKGEGLGLWLATPEQKRQTGPEDAEMSLHFFLDMSKLGNVHIVMTVSAHRAGGEIYVADRKIAAYLEEMLPDLEEKLAERGFGQVGFQCRVTDENLLQAIGGEVAKAAGASTHTLVDVTA